ncbi:MAG: flavin reductase family protein [Alcanivorax nanhaiticus]
MSLTTKAIDPLHFRKALGHFASGLTVITSQIEDEPIGFTCQSFYSVSTAPPLVSFSVKRDSFSYPKIRRAGRFAVNILSDEQAAVSNIFAQQGADKWKETDWTTSPLGNPVIGGSLHWLDCEIHAEHQAGDHLIVIGEVRALSLQPTTATHPLLYFKGQYCNLDASVTC